MLLKRKVTDIKKMYLKLVMFVKYVFFIWRILVAFLEEDINILQADTKLNINSV